MGCNIVKRIPQAMGIAIRKAQIKLITQRCLEREIPLRCLSEKIQSKSIITPRCFHPATFDIAFLTFHVMIVFARNLFLIRFLTVTYVTQKE